MWCSPSTGEVKGVDEAEGCGSGSATGGKVSGKVPPELSLLVHATKENLLVLVLEGEVEGLGGEVPDHIGKVTTPEAGEALFLGDAHKAVNDACENQDEFKTKNI